MAKLDEIPRGQLSTIILMCLTENDKYGYEIIDDVLNKTNGKMSIKQPSLYSSLKRMEEQSLISSYWRDSEIGGKRHYYHLTDLGKKHLEKWQTNISFSEIDANDDKINNNETKVLQQSNIFDVTNTLQKITPQAKPENEATNSIPEGQLDLFSQETSHSSKKEYTSIDEFLGLPSSINSPEKQKPIVTEYEKPEEVERVSKFEYIKKTNQSFASAVKNIRTVEEKRFVEKNYIEKEEQSQSKMAAPIEIEQKTILQEMPSATIMPEGIKFEPAENKHTLLEDGPLSPSLTEQESEATNANLEQTNIEEYPKKVDIRSLEGYVGNNSIMQSIETKEEAFSDAALLPPHKKIETKEAVTPTSAIENPKKDDGVLITERLDIKDIPKQPRYEARRFEIYLSDDSISPKLKINKSENYEDRIKDLYEKSMSNAENQELEIIDSKIKFSSYKELQAFYEEQNIKFKPYQKTLYKSTKDYDMIRITKLKMLTSLLLFGTYSLICTILGIVFRDVAIARLNYPITFMSIPAIIFLFFAIRLFLFERSPQKRIAYDINKFKLNYKYLVISILIIPLTIAINMLFGFTFTNFVEFSVTIVYPCLLCFIYLIYYIIQKVLTKLKSLY